MSFVSPLRRPASPAPLAPLAPLVPRARSRFPQVTASGVLILLVLATYALARMALIAAQVTITLIGMGFAAVMPRR